MNEFIKEYLENGIGFNCNTNELKELNTLFRKSDDNKVNDLKFLEKRKKELNNLKIDNTALGSVENDLKTSEINQINSKINLIIISLRFKNINDFLEDKLK